MTEYDPKARKELGGVIRHARRAAGYAKTADWAEAIGRSTRAALGAERGEPAGPETYAAIEKALKWDPGLCYAILEGDDYKGRGSVGGDAQDDASSNRSYVEAPGAKVESGITNEDLLREIVRSRAEFDQIRADVRELGSGVRTDIESLSQRVARLEQRGS